MDIRYCYGTAKREFHVFHWETGSCLKQCTVVTPESLKYMKSSFPICFLWTECLCASEIHLWISLPWGAGTQGRGFGGRRGHVGGAPMMGLVTRRWRACLLGLYSLPWANTMKRPPSATHKRAFPRVRPDLTSGLQKCEKWICVVNKPTLIWVSQVAWW